MSFETIILQNLCTNSDYTQKVLSHLKKEFFDEYLNKELFTTITDYINEYKTLPTKSVIHHEITKSSKYNDKQEEEILKQLDSVFEIVEKQNTEWLVNETEKYAQNISFENAVIKCFDIYKEDKKNKAKAIEIMKDALSIEFNSDCGINFFDDASIEKRFERYNSPDVIYKTGLETFDIVCGGLKSKAITVLMGGSGTGKTAGMISLACGCLKNGIDVAYFTMEMDETEISKRVEANLLDVEINSIKNLDKDVFKTSIQKLKEKSYGELKIKEFPTACASCLDFERILDHWKVKDGFEPKVIISDYLNIMSSNRISKESNSYSLIKGIVEEFRGLCTKRNAAGLTGTQLNREGMDNSKLNFKNISDSVGTIFTTDVLVGIISTEQTREENYQIFQVMKNRNTGIIDYFFPMRTNFSCSKIIDDQEGCYNDQILLNNNPETIQRIENLRKDNTRRNNKNFSNDVILRKKEDKIDIIKFEEAENDIDSFLEMMV